ncbi:hypothetical protein B0H14DRAFT_3449218 [Mycena olivaceomarginata]|nr:hypothetical protein B0H14DRAFT_3449218 [Mycena olivaceomarginata]
MFKKIVDLQIYGGSFYNVSGDVHLQTHQHLTIQDHNPQEAALQLPAGSPMAGSVSYLSPRTDIIILERLGPVIFGVALTLPHPARFPTGPLPNVSLADLAPAHESTNYRDPSMGGESWHNSNLLPHLDRFQGEPAQSSDVVKIIAENVNHNHHYESWKQGMDVLHRAVALEALYDSADSFPQPRCHPETRTKILDNLYKWAVQNYSRSACSIRWLYGPAGAGKSAIMQTLCQRLQDDGRLGGSFFFKRGHITRGNAKVLFATLAYQLALHDCRLKGPILQRAVHDPSVVGRGMDVQLRKLMVEPCQSLDDTVPLIFLIDGLDECALKHPSTFRFLVASRPEPHIREKLTESSLHGLYDSVNVERSFEDIRLYFRDEFARIHHEHGETMGSIPTPWPSSHILEMLVEKSSGYFIYASTVIKFIDDKNWRPTDQLEAVQNLANDNSCLPFEALDQLYTYILSGVPARSRAKLCDILCVITNFGLDLRYIEPLLDLKSGDIRLTLRNLHSVLNIGSEYEVITVHHASFRDFLHDRQRSSIFYTGPDSEHRMNVACAVLKALSYPPNDPWHDIAWYAASVWAYEPPALDTSPQLHLLQRLSPSFGL